MNQKNYKKQGGWVLRLFFATSTVTNTVTNTVTSIINTCLRNIAMYALSFEKLNHITHPPLFFHFLGEDQ